MIKGSHSVAYDQGVYFIDVFRIKFDVSRERSASKAHQSAVSYGFYKTLQVVDFRRFNAFVNFLFLIRLDDNESIAAANGDLCSSMAVTVPETLECIGAADKSIYVTDQLSYFT